MVDSEPSQAPGKPPSKWLRYFEASWWAPFQVSPSGPLHPSCSFATAPPLSTFPHDLFWPSFACVSSPLLFSSEPNALIVVQFDFSFCFLVQLGNYFVFFSPRFIAWSFLLASLPLSFGASGHLELFSFRRTSAWTSCNYSDSAVSSARWSIKCRKFSTQHKIKSNALTFWTFSSFLFFKPEMSLVLFLVSSIFFQVFISSCFRRAIRLANS